MIYIIIYLRIAVEVFGRHLGVVDTILSTTLSFLLKMCYNLVYYFFIPVLIKGSLYKATRKQIRWTNVKEEKNESNQYKNSCTNMCNSVGRTNSLVDAGYFISLCIRNNSNILLF